MKTPEDSKPEAVVRVAIDARKVETISQGSLDVSRWAPGLAFEEWKRSQK